MADEPGGGGILGFDPETVLVHDAAVLLDPTFLGALHAEMEAELGEEQARTTLLQIGFLHGICDAYRVVDAAFGGGPDAARAPFVPSLPILLESGAGARTFLAGAVEVGGVWPDGREAEGRLVRRRGAPPGEAGCFVSAGYTSGWLSGTLEADLLAVETHCSARGEPRCRFVAREPEDWRARGDARALELLDALPFSALRQLARTAIDRRGSERDPRSYDAGAAVVHIWGPVMVIPFTSPDEAMRALELIGTDPSAREVSVVVVDLTDAVLDEAFGAATLERVIETAEAWGAEILLAGVSSLSERVVADLERPPLAVHKQLPEAIAAAFQIARAQRAPT